MVKTRYFSVNSNTSKSSTTASQSHRLLMMEDVLEPILCYLDTSSLKSCRLTCSSWTPVATRFLMKRTYCAFPSMEYKSRATIGFLTKAITSLKIDEDLLDELIPKRIPLSFLSHCKSISMSFIAKQNGISGLNFFVNLTSSTNCPQLNHLRIDFKYCGKGRGLNFTRGLYNRLLHFRPSPRSPPPLQEVYSIRNLSNLRSLHLIFENQINFLEVSTKFLQVFLQKKVVAHLKELVIEFEGLGSYFQFHTEYKSVIEMLQKCEDVLGSLTVFKIQGNIPFGVEHIGTEDLTTFLDFVTNRELPGTSVSLGLTKEIKELQVGSWLIAEQKEGDLNPPEFLPGILTPTVACVLQTLDLSGFYLHQGNANIYPSVSFPHMPCLRKLTVEEVTLLCIRNFPMIFKNSSGIRVFRVKNSSADRMEQPFLGIEEGLRIHQWKEEWDIAEYPSLRRLELGDSSHVKDCWTLRKMTEIFPNVEVFQFTIDERSRRLPRNHPMASCQVNNVPLQKIVEGLEGWKSLKQLSLTYWPLYTIDELLDHFIGCAEKLKSLRLYDFRRRDNYIPIVLWRDVYSDQHLIQIKEKLLELKKSSEIVFLLQKFKCSHLQRNDENRKLLQKCSIMEELFEFAEKNGISNFRKGMELKVY